MEETDERERFRAKKKKISLHNILTLKYPLRVVHFWHHRATETEHQAPNNWTAQHTNTPVRAETF